MLEELGGRAVLVEVELVDQEQVGPHPLDDLGHGRRLGVAGGREVLDQLSLDVAVQGGVEGGDADLGWAATGGGAAGEAAPVAMVAAATSSAASVRRIGRVRITSTSRDDSSLDTARYCCGAFRVAPRISSTMRAALTW